VGEDTTRLRRVDCLPRAKPRSGRIELVRKKGFEPSRPCGHKLLRLNRSRYYTRRAAIFQPVAQSLARRNDALHGRIRTYSHRGSLALCEFGWGGDERPLNSTDLVITMEGRYGIVRVARQVIVAFAQAGSAKIVDQHEVAGDAVDLRVEETPAIV
jgi:hypothetical protein